LKSHDNVIFDGARGTTEATKQSPVICLKIEPVPN
jgi:hypothetical protein